MFGVLLLHGSDIGAPKCAIPDLQDIGYGAGRTAVIASLQLRLTGLVRAGPKRRVPIATFELFERGEQDLLITGVVPIHQRAVDRLDPDQQVIVCVAGQLVAHVAGGGDGWTHSDSECLPRHRLAIRPRIAILQREEIRAQQRAGIQGEGEYGRFE